MLEYAADHSVLRTWLVSSCKYLFAPLEGQVQFASAAACAVVGEPQLCVGLRIGRERYSTATTLTLSAAIRVVSQSIGEPID